MAYVIIRNENNRWQIGREILAVCDTTADLDTIVEDIENICVGSRAIVTGTGIKYILCTDRKSWAPLASRIGYSVPVTQILYYSDDGSNLLHTEGVEPGSSGSWDGAPTKDPDELYEYIFQGWAKEPNKAEVDEDAVTNVTSERKVYAVYKRRAISGFLMFAAASVFRVLSNRNLKSWNGSLFYSTDAISWQEWDGVNAIVSAQDLGEHHVYIRGAGNSKITAQNSGGEFVVYAGTTGTTVINFRVEGNVESLLDFEAAAAGEHPIMAGACFARLFSGCTGLTEAPELPATTIANACYSSMFSGCTGLTEAPELPATTLANSCYLSMFSGCTGLTEAPELPATTLADSCYSSMFSGCTGLTRAPELPATTLADSCYSLMFSGCTGLTRAPELPATTLAQHCYERMFMNCTGLTEAPELPATVIQSYAYQYMFQNCKALATPPELPATTLGYSCYTLMFSGCTGLTEAPELPATTLASACYSSMFSGCTGLTQAPELPATTLADSCYSSMFSGCTGLTQAPELPATTLAQRCYSSMFSGCSGIKLSETQVDEYTIPYRIPSSGSGVDATNALKDMFKNTGGTFTGTPAITTTYYLAAPSGT